MAMGNRLKRRLATIPLIIIFIVFPSIARAVSVNDLGDPSGFVNDYTGTLSTSDQFTLSTIATDLEKANGTEMAFVIIDSTDGQNIDSYALDLFNKWGIGKKDIDNGLLVLIALKDIKWRVTTGYGLESILPDDLVAKIMNDEAVPSFKAGNYGEGLIKAAVKFQSLLQNEKYQTSSDTPSDPPSKLITVGIPLLGVLILAFGFYALPKKKKLQGMEQQ
jgi:uncharacterized protein